MKIVDRNGREILVGDRIQSPVDTMWRVSYLGEDGLIKIIETTNWLEQQEMCTIVGDSGFCTYAVHPEMFCPVNPFLPFRRPMRGTQKSIGFDLYLSENHTVLSTGVTWDERSQTRERFPATLKTNTRCNFPTGWGGLLRERSSIGKSGVHCVSGTIDNDYKGELMICVVNFMHHRPFTVGDRVAQLVMVPYFQETDDEETIASGERGNKGFGSTGK